MIKYLFTISVLLSSTVCVLAADDGPSAPAGMVLVEVDGARLTMADLESKNPSSLFQARNSFYDAERKAMDELVDQYLLERQAKKEGLTVEQLLQKHVNSTLPKDPSDETLRVYYEGVETTQPYEIVKDQIIDSLRQRRLNKAKAAYVQSLRKEAKIVTRLAPPRLAVSLNNTPVRGAQDAPVVMVEFADYECPYCQQAQPALDRLEAEYKGKLAMAFKDTPLPMHPHAQKAAEAAHCAGLQGKYWEYHDMLFTSKELEVPQLKEQAGRLQLDRSAFDKCLDTGAESNLVKTQLSEATTLGLQGTPSFFINGRFFAGALTYEALRDVIEEELARSAAHKTETASR